MIFKTFGFTLLEIMISLFILTIVGLMISTGLTLSVKAQQHFDIKNSALTDAQLAMMIIERDIQQIIDRSITDESGKKLPALLLSESEIELTSLGYLNPFLMAEQSTLQRVTYKLDGTDLVRLTWPILDRAANTKVIMQKLIKNVATLHFQLMSSTSNATDKEITHESLGIKIEMRVAHLGYIKRVIPIAMTIFIRDKNV